MYGLILVEPEAGLPKVDRELYIMQSEFYVKPGEAGKPGTLDMEKGAAEQPTHVVFNGSAGALTGDTPWSSLEIEATTEAGERTGIVAIDQFDLQAPTTPMPHNHGLLRKAR